MKDGINIKVPYSTIISVVSTPENELIIKFRRTETIDRLRQHLKKQLPGDQLDKN